MLPFDIDTFNQLREEAHESWEHKVTDGIIYCFHHLDSITSSAFVGYDETIERNLRGRWWEILIHHRNGNFFCVIIDYIPNHPCTIAKDQSLSANSDNSMLITVGEFMQNPQRMSGGLKCSVWLKRLKDTSGIVGDILRESLDSFCGNSVFDFEDGESSFGIRSGGFKKSQLPHDIIKGGVKVMQNIPYDNSYTTSDSLNLDGIDISRIIRIGVSTTEEWFSVLPCADEFIERLYMIRRPIELQPWPIEWVHMLYSQSHSKGILHPKPPIINTTTCSGVQSDTNCKVSSN